MISFWGGVTNAQEQSEMSHRAIFIKSQEDSNPAENYCELCLILEKFLKMATVLLFLTSCW